MKGALAFLLLLLSLLPSNGYPEVHRVHVGGEVPRPGPVEITGKKLTFDDVLRKVGLDLSSFYDYKKGPDKLNCPLRIQLLRNGQIVKSFVPDADQAALKTERVQLNDVIVVTDLRKSPERIEERRKRIEQILELGSTRIGDEIQAVAELRFEYDQWLNGNKNAPGDGKDRALQKEVIRLCEEGKGAKIIQLLELDRGALVLTGLGPAHPVLRKNEELKRMFEEQSGKKSK